MSTDKIIVILCTYRGEKYIAKQLDSILAQNYPSIEIHVSDDFSDDATPKIIQSYCKKFPNIIFHQNAQNIGFLRNFENSLLKSKGKYVALCDQDDIWHPDKLTISMNELKKIEKNYPKQPILIHSDLEFIDEKDQLDELSFFNKKGLCFSEEKSLAQILGHCGVMGNTILMNSHLIDKALPFPAKLKYHDYWLALINECYGIRKTILQPLVKYRIHETNTSNNNTAIKNVSTLPFSQDNRLSSIKYLLDHYQLSKNDEIVIKSFYEYLLFNKNRFSHFMFLFKNNFFKSKISYQLGAFFRIMTAKYNNNEES